MSVCMYTCIYTLHLPQWRKGFRLLGFLRACTRCLEREASRSALPQRARPPDGGNQGEVWLFIASMSNINCTEIVLIVNHLCLCYCILSQSPLSVTLSLSASCLLCVFVSDVNFIRLRVPRPSYRDPRMYTVSPQP